MTASRDGEMAGGGERGGRGQGGRCKDTFTGNRNTNNNNKQHEPTAQLVS